MKLPRKKRSSAIKAPVSEIFFSYQGEGIHVGQPQIFVRFAGCNLSCAYCDTPQRDGRRVRMMSVARVMECVSSLRRTHACSVVSITGGEPLLHEAFLSELLPVLRRGGDEIYLETNGTLPKVFERLSAWVDTVAMDIKLPSACHKAHWALHRSFLHVAGSRAMVKVVLDNAVTHAEVKKVAETVLQVDPQCPVVLQPATSRQRRSKTIAPAQLYRYVHYLRSRGLLVQVTPQMQVRWDIK